MTTTANGGIPSNPQLRLIGAIEGYTSTHDGIAPRFEDLTSVLGYKSPGSIWTQLVSMREAGFVEWEDRKPRTLRLTERGSELLPLVDLDPLSIVPQGAFADLVRMIERYQTELSFRAGRKPPEVEAEIRSISRELGEIVDMVRRAEES